MADDADVFKPWQRPRDLVDAATYRNWLLAQDGASLLPWEADPLHMPLLASVNEGGIPQHESSIAWDTALKFGEQDSAGYGKVRNWVKVDDLGGLGALYCGSYGGKFYLRTTNPGGNEAEEIAQATDEETLGFMLCHEAGAAPIMPRRACPMSARENLLKIGGKWRSDLKWDTLINGALSIFPPEFDADDSAEYHVTCTFRFLTLRLVQVGEYLCFHTQITPYGVSNGAHYAIGHSSFKGRSYLNYGYHTLYLGWRFHSWSAEPPWGRDRSASWTGEESNEQEAIQTPEEANTPYCRVFPRVHVGEGWSSWWYWKPGTYSAEDVEARADNFMATYWNGSSPDWMEEFLGIDLPTRWDEDGGTDDESALYLWKYNFQPAATAVKVFSAHLPHPCGSGHVYLALYTATIDDCLITSSCCNPYGYD